MEFLGISFWEFLLILVVIVVVVGPAKIPGIMRTIGTIVRNIRKTTAELTASINREIELENLKQAGDPESKPEEKKAAAPAPSPPATPAAPAQQKPATHLPPRTAAPAPRPNASADSLTAGRPTHDEH